MTATVADERTLRLLEYDRIMEQLAELAEGEPGREQILGVRPTADREAVQLRLDETEEAVRLLRQGRAPALGPIRSVAQPVAAAQRGAVLSGEDLAAVLALARAGRRAARRLLQEAGLERLSGLAREIPALDELEAELASALADDGSLLDGASPRLGELRRLKQAGEERLRKRMEALVRRLQPYLQEGYITHRGGRAVLPVRQEHRPEVPGVVHDQSASGATLFIEPLQAVPLNNEIRRLEREEEEEVERILRRLSRSVGEHAEALTGAEAAVARLDAALARGRLAASWSAARPRLLDRPGMILKEARHPLLGERAVPIDLHLGRDFRALVITGPNTGGKTVSLKTCGLFALLLQSGLFLPAAEGSALGLFRHVACDTGDEQSIEQNLSTFSSHLRQIVRMLDRVGEGSLLLLDELGAGTDPEEGSALAKALLEYIVARGALAVVTSHYRELKSFAHQHPLLANASVEFDAATLAPTYRLQIGVPGKSNALAIARRLGLPEAILDAARRQQSESDQAVEELLAGLAQDRTRAEAERVQVETERRRLAQERERLEAERRRLEQARAEWRLQARERLDRLEEAARARLEQWWKEAEAAASGGAGLDPALRDRVRTRLADAVRELHESLPGAAEAVAGPGGTGEADGAEPLPIRSGQAVHVRSLGQEGVVLEEPDLQGQVHVAIGPMRLRLPAADLAPLKPPRTDRRSEAAGVVTGRAKARAASVGMRKALEVQPELHLRGMRVAEALEDLEKYVDDALMAGLKQVRIVHGKGTGVMRKAVQEYLSKHPQVAGWRLGGPGEGSIGVTVVEFKD